MRFKFDKRKSVALRSNPKRGIGFEERRKRNGSFMKKASKTKRTISAESIARLAENGKDVSSYFTNKGKMMAPLESVGIDLNQETIED